MVVKEALRLYPPAWLLTPRQARTDLDLGGQHLPAGSVMMISPYVIHHNPAYFPEPEHFDPERFSPEQERQVPKYAYISCGAGQHVCLGNSFAMMEARLLLATVAQRFTLTLEPTHKVETDALITLGVKNGMRMRLGTPAER